MPEISQDAFESLHPKVQPVSVEEWRSRSNSTNSRRLTPASSDTVAAESNFWPSNVRLSGDPQANAPIPTDSSTTAPEQNYGYKRESSHR